ncbi:MAG: endonuclease domain-containing protein [Candidatus Margulisiibacteriota bacterium]|nr:endonuclease domain-containing protein [Candidatus Margulisiibacteriota bacterium]
MREKKKIFARRLRKEQTKVEKVVWELIRNRKFMGLKFRRQHVIEGFVVDFYCNNLRLGIEIDGGIHLRQKEYDRLRQEIIESEDIKIVRITNKEIKANKRIILKKIKQFIDNHIAPLPFSPHPSAH